VLDIKDEGGGMKDEGKTPRMLEFLFGDAAEAAQRGASKPRLAVVELEGLGMVIPQRGQLSYERCRFCRYSPIL
jgi:hypothetical protein